MPPGPSRRAYGLGLAAIFVGSAVGAWWLGPPRSGARPAAASTAPSATSPAPAAAGVDDPSRGVAPAGHESDAAVAEQQRRAALEHLRGDATPAAVRTLIEALATDRVRANRELALQLLREVALTHGDADGAILAALHQAASDPDDVIAEAALDAAAEVAQAQQAGVE